MEALGEDHGDEDTRAPTRVTPTRRSKRGAVVIGGGAASTPRRGNDNDGEPTDIAGELVSGDDNDGLLSALLRVRRGRTRSSAQTTAAFSTELRTWSVVVDNNDNIDDINTDRQLLVRRNGKNTVKGHRVGAFA